MGLDMAINNSSLGLLVIMNPGSCASQIGMDPAATWSSDSNMVTVKTLLQSHGPWQQQEPQTLTQTLTVVESCTQTWPLAAVLPRKLHGQNGSTGL